MVQKSYFRVHYAWLENGIERRAHTVVTAATQLQADVKFQAQNRHVRVVPERDPEFLARMSARSQELIELGVAGGMSRGALVALVGRLARNRGLRGWADVRDEADYVALIEAVRTTIENEQRARLAAL